MSKIKNSLFDSIFLETHSELETLNDELNKLYEVYQTNNLKDDSNSDDNIDNKNESIMFEEGQEDNANNNITSKEVQEDDVNDIFTSRQIEEFKKIYILKPIQAFIKNESKSSTRLKNRMMRRI
ncbi:20684_t:CDS:1 [Cetraspora pellucida]|uniref:20684_t:CDS:1 n=1 Tax=Cetraspora pellucida TaxID=1433469 RepID=A0A9N9N737_9GLOM|nr:20684_t:CDS:1 [Cetraspora pellucida]